MSPPWNVKLIRVVEGKNSFVLKFKKKLFWEIFRNLQADQNKLECLYLTA